MNAIKSITSIILGLFVPFFFACSSRGNQEAKLFEEITSQATAQSDQPTPSLSADRWLKAGKKKYESGNYKGAI